MPTLNFTLHTATTAGRFPHVNGTVTTCAPYDVLGSSDKIRSIRRRVARDLIKRNYAAAVVCTVTNFDGSPLIEFSSTGAPGTGPVRTPDGWTLHAVDVVRGELATFKAAPEHVPVLDLFTGHTITKTAAGYTVTGEDARGRPFCDARKSIYGVLLVVMRRHYGLTNGRAFMRAAGNFTYVRKALTVDLYAR